MNHGGAREPALLKLYELQPRKVLIIPIKERQMQEIIPEFNT